jgi:hypothetical protein
MDTNSLLGALMQLRTGRVLTPSESSEASSYLTNAPALNGYSLTVGVPHWLVAQLENDSAPRQQQFGLLTTQDQQNPVFLLVVQSGSTQFRLLMHMNDANVQALLRDARSRGRLNVLLDVEHRSKVSILSMRMPDAADTVLPNLLDAARDQPGHLARVLKLGAHYTLPEAVPSLLPGVEVSDMVAVLVADTNAELADGEVTDLTGSSPPEARAEEIATRLH